jgi:pyrroloquinoline quinone biosynthesis protein B
MKILVLGAAAGGGVPQWNCRCRVCQAAHDGTLPHASQASLAVSADGDNWFLINASPDLRQQICDNPSLHPRAAPRHSPIAGVVLTNADVDAVAGLLTLREGWPFTLYATEAVQAVLAANSIFAVLDPRLVRREILATERPQSLALADGRPSGLRVTAFTVAGKTPLYLEDAGDSADTVGLRIEDARDGSHFFVVAGCGEVTADLRRRLTAAPLLFFDGTLWRDDEMIAAGLGAKTGRRMAHVSMEVAMAALGPLAVRRKYFLHVNNSNPAWIEDSPERRRLRQAGWDIPADGSEIMP